jgi:hypothetical protein
VLGDQDAVVAEAKPFNLHGVTYSDVTLTFTDGSTRSARLGPEAVPEGLQAGERVVATMAANMVVSLRRP